MTGIICDDCGTCEGQKTEHAAEIKLDNNPECEHCGGELRIGEITARQDESGWMD